MYWSKRRRELLITVRRSGVERCTASRSGMIRPSSVRPMSMPFDSPLPNHTTRTLPRRASRRRKERVQPRDGGAAWDLERVVDEEDPLLGDELGHGRGRDRDDVGDVDDLAQPGRPLHQHRLVAGGVEVVVAEVEDDLHPTRDVLLGELVVRLRVALLEDDAVVVTAPVGRDEVRADPGPGEDANGEDRAEPHARDARVVVERLPTDADARERERRQGSRMIVVGPGGSPRRVRRGARRGGGARSRGCGAGCARRRRRSGTSASHAGRRVDPRAP